MIAIGLISRLRFARKSRLQLEEKNKLIAEEKEIADQQRERAERSEKFKQQFLANMSHEIRTPMNAVMGMTNLLIEKAPRSDQFNYLDGIKKSSDNLLHIINDILDLSKIEAGKIELEQIDFSVRDMVEQVKQTLTYKAEEKGLELITSIDSNIPDVLIGDPARLNHTQPEDWDAVEAYLRSLRSPRGRTNPIGDPVAGKAVFMAGNCQNCHGGPLWTSSERYFAPVKDSDASLTTLAQAGVPNIGMVRADQVANTDTTKLTVIQTDANGAPHRHTCVVRKVGTFDADGPNGRGADEVRQNNMPAQGPDGYNIPSLLGMATGAPYLHNSPAATLKELLSNTFKPHLQTGNQVFAPTAQEVEDLIAFVESIDEGMLQIAVPTSQRFCPAGYVPPPG